MIRGWLALALLIGPAALADDAQDVARNAVRAYLEGDVARLRALWIEDGNGFRKVEIESLSRSRVKCVTPAGITTAVVSSDASAAAVNVAAGWWETLRAASAPPRFRTKNLAIVLAPHDGVWRVTKWET